MPPFQGFYIAYRVFYDNFKPSGFDVVCKLGLLYFFLH
jgi:hypothetical protein